MIELVYIKLEVKAMTKKLYYEDSYIKEFDAVVLSCETLDDGKYAIVTDSTAFFPEGGGQPSDIGVLGEAKYNLRIRGWRQRSSRVRQSNRGWNNGSRMHRL